MDIYERKNKCNFLNSIQFIPTIQLHQKHRGGVCNTEKMENNNGTNIIDGTTFTLTEIMVNNGAIQLVPMWWGYYLLLAGSVYLFIKWMY